MELAQLCPWEAGQGGQEIHFPRRQTTRADLSIIAPSIAGSGSSSAIGPRNALPGHYCWHIGVAGILQQVNEIDDSAAAALTGTLSAMKLSGCGIPAASRAVGCVVGPSHLWRTVSAMRSAIMMVGMLVLVRETSGITEASAMNRFSAPTTLPLGSTTVCGLPDRPSGRCRRDARRIARCRAHGAPARRDGQAVQAAGGHR